MSTIYITTQGATVQRRSGQFLVCKDSSVLQNLPETGIRQLVLFGNVNLTTPVVSFCLDQQIEVVYLTQGGRYRGRLNGDSGKSAELRHKQYERAFDKAFCLRQAKTIVSGKVQNLAAFARRQTEAQVVQQEMNSLKKAIDSTHHANSIETLLGIEGSASATYFRLFAKWLPEGWTFVGRRAHPPADAVNAMLSLSYTLVYNRIVSNLNLIGLDPYQGYFHAPRHGHASLASDLMEEFRPLISDSLVLKLIRRKQIRPSDIVKENSEFRLCKEASKVFFTEFENKMNSYRDKEGLNLCYAEIIKRQAHHFVRVITGEEPHYKPFTIK